MKEQLEELLDAGLLPGAEKTEEDDTTHYAVGKIEFEEKGLQDMAGMVDEARIDNYLRKVSELELAKEELLEVLEGLVLQCRIDDVVPIEDKTEEQTISYNRAWCMVHAVIAKHGR